VESRLAFHENAMETVQVLRPSSRGISNMNH
jgi:hypothetical protein